MLLKANKTFYMRNCDVAMCGCPWITVWCTAASTNTIKRSTKDTPLWSGRVRVPKEQPQCLNGRLLLKVTQKEVRWSSCCPLSKKHCLIGQWLSLKLCYINPSHRWALGLLCLDFRVSQLSFLRPEYTKQGMSLAWKKVACGC